MPLSEETVGGVNLPSTVTLTTYTYDDETWGDLLTAYNGVPRTYDEIGNLLTDGTWTYTWQNGRELACAALQCQKVHKIPQEHNA